METEKLERSCGAVVFRRAEGRVLYVVVQEMAGAYSYPKGHMEGNETERETAEREVFEEIGIRPDFIEGFTARDEYELSERPGWRKRVTYFLSELGTQQLRPRPGEIRQVLEVPFEEALILFRHESSRDILRAADEFIRTRLPENT